METIRSCFYFNHVISFLAGAVRPLQRRTKSGLLLLSLSLALPLENHNKMLLPLPRALTLVSIQSAVGAPQVPGMPRNMRRRIQSRLPRKRWLPRKFPVPSPPVLARDLLPRRPTRFRRLRRRVRARPRSETRFTWVSMDVHARGAAGDAHTTCSVEHAAAHCLIFRVRRRVAHSSTYLSSTSLDQQKKEA